MPCLWFSEDKLSGLYQTLHSGCRDFERGTGPTLVWFRHNAKLLFAKLFCANLFCCYHQANYGLQLGLRPGFETAIWSWHWTIKPWFRGLAPPHWTYQDWDIRGKWNVSNISMAKWLAGTFTKPILVKEPNSERHKLQVKLYVWSELFNCPWERSRKTETGKFCTLKRWAPGCPLKALSKTYKLKVDSGHSFRQEPTQHPLLPLISWKVRRKVLFTLTSGDMQDFFN